MVFCIVELGLELVSCGVDLGLELVSCGVELGLMSGGCGVVAVDNTVLCFGWGSNGVEGLHKLSAIIPEK